MTVGSVGDSLMTIGSSPTETPCVRKSGMFECKGIINLWKSEILKISDIHFLRLLQDSRQMTKMLLMSEILFSPYIL